MSLGEAGQMNQKFANKRNTVMINRKFQIQMIIKFLLINALVLALFFGIMFLFLNSEIDAQFKSAHNRFKSFQEMLFPIILTLSIISFFVSGLFVSFVVLMASFRIAGPMFRFNEALKSVAGRNLNPLTHIRDKDQFGECVHTLDGMVKNYRDDICAIQHDVDAVAKIILKKKTDPDLAKRIKSIQKLIAQYKF
jgi:methyl-accepting chemotaxis protein